jgi:hypothetical protein
MPIGAGTNMQTKMAIADQNIAFDVIVTNFHFAAFDRA